MMKNLFAAVVFSILTLLIPLEAISQNSRPLVWDINSLDHIRQDRAYLNERDSIIKAANQDLSKIPVVVTQKKKTFAPNSHYYCSMGTYWWPDPENPGKYINKDGVANPETREYDHTKLYELRSRCKNLSEAYYLTRKRKYYKAFLSQIKAWFVAPETYMLPNFEYAQVIPGSDGNRGRSTGLIEAYSFNTVIESIRLVNSVKKIDRRTMRALQAWFGDFATWADKGEFGESMRMANNNIGLAYDVTLVNMYLFAGMEERAKEIADQFAEKRINKQITEDGLQPTELRRSRAFSYSVYNLIRIVDFCYLARYWNPHYFQDNSERINKAFIFLGQYLNEPEKFPYKQISSWKDCKTDYEITYNRLDALK